MDVVQFASRQLADHKIPRRVLVLEEIPKGPTGKIQRIGLADELGVTSQSDDVKKSQEYISPRNEYESFTAELWSQVLGQERISVNTGFLEAGGDSIRAAQLVSRINEELDLSLAVVDLWDAETIAQQAEIIEKRLETDLDAG
jgi:acyl carrier protein